MIRAATADHVDAIAALANARAADDETAQPQLWRRPVHPA